MRGFVIGLIAGGVLLIAAFAVPALVRGGAAEREALAQAELARRQLHHYDPMLPIAADRAATAELRDADFEMLLAEEHAALDELSQRFSSQVSQARELDRKSHLASTDLAALQTTPASIKSAVTDFDQAVAANDQLLAEAVQTADAALSAARGAYGVALTAGQAHMVAAGQKYLAAQRLRTRLQGLQTDAVTAAQRGARTAALAAHAGNIEVAEAVETLAADAAELEASLADATAQQASLAQTISQREAELQQIRDQIQQAQAEQVQLEETGFTAGNDSSFQQYRQSYTSVAQRLRELQTREALLAQGGYESVQFDELKPLESELEVDGPVIGLDELQRRKAILDDKVNRYQLGLDALRRQVETVRTIGRTAEEQAATLQQSVAQAVMDFEALTERTKALAEQALAKEQEAIAAATEAQQALAAAQSAADQIVRQAQQHQREYDPQRQNERLRTLISDQTFTTLARLAEARAHALIGRVYALQVGGLESYQNSWQLISAAMPQVAFDAAAIETALNSAREQGGAALGAAAATLTEIADAGEYPWLKIAARASLAAVEHLRSQVYSAQRDEYRTAAATAITTAAEAAGQDPRGDVYDLLRERLSQAE